MKFTDLAGLRNPAKSWLECRLIAESGLLEMMTRIYSQHGYVPFHGNLNWVFN